MYKANIGARLQASYALFFKFKFIRPYIKVEFKK